MYFNRPSIVRIVEIPIIHVLHTCATHRLCRGARFSLQKTFLFVEENEERRSLPGMMINNTSANNNIPLRVRARATDVYARRLHYYIFIIFYTSRAP